MRLTTRILSSITALLPLACDESLDADSAGPSTDEYTDPGKADGALVDPSVSATGMTLWMEPNAAIEFEDGQQVVVLRGRVSKNLAAVSSFVPDDAFGAAQIISPRRFEVRLTGGHEINTLLSGVPLMLDIEAATGAVRNYTARVVVAPRFARFEGDNGLWMHESIRPVLTRDFDVSYQGRVFTNVEADAVIAFTDDDADPSVRQIDDEEWRLDWSFGLFSLAFDPPTDPVHVIGTFGQTEVDKRAGIDLRVVELGLTTDSDGDIWPAASCDPEIAACMTALPADAVDFGSCGDYRPTQRCIGFDACEGVDGEPLSLSPTDASALEPATQAYNEACAGSFFTFCSIDTVSAFSLPACLAEPATLDALVGEVLLTDQNLSTQVDPQYGEEVSRQTLETQRLGTSGMLDALDAAAGSTTMNAWSYLNEVPCHNCTEFYEVQLLHYPESDAVFVLQGRSGYDS